MVCSVEYCDGTSIPLPLFVSAYLNDESLYIKWAMPSKLPTVQNIHTCPFVPLCGLSSFESRAKDVADIRMEWSSHFALEVCNQTEELSHLVHRLPLYS